MMTSVLAPPALDFVQATAITRKVPLGLRHATFPEATLCGGIGRLAFCPARLRPCVPGPRCSSRRNDCEWPGA
jgi:hypothetical protein